MGPLLVTPTLLRVDGEQAKLSINMRRPAGMSTPAFQEKLDATLALLKKDIDGAISEVGERYVGEPAIAATDGPLVPTLLDIYRKETGDSAAQPISIRGGTYARLFPGAVSFGPSLPGHAYRGHAPDESIELDALALMGRSIFSAIIALDAHTLRGPPVAAGAPPRGAQN
jgi:acetylornithine deacetylase/succinyl-diaminopimelate desuccinylase-like protein